MDLIYITNDSFHARCADEAGVDRVMIDLEINGKIERQGHLNTVISNHSLDDLTRIKSLLSNAKLMVRVNPLFDGSKEEINRCLELGAEILMLPMFKRTEEVEAFVQLVSGRAKVCLLLETPEALARAEAILSIRGIDEVHIGLNDLHLGLRLTFMFELLSGGLVEYLTGILKKNKLKFGFGGVARLNTGLLSAELILSEHIRMGSTQVILSRDMNKIFESNDDAGSIRCFRLEVKKLRNYMVELERMCAKELDQNKRKLLTVVDKIVSVKV